ncbi:MAG: hypothetical protein E7D27_09300 [Clostridium celatum]|nr:hypothetical protein [Clostridium celatum]
MISRNRLNKIKKALMKDLDKLIIIKFSDGSELKVTGATINESFANYDEGTEFTRAIKEKEIVSCSEYGMLIHVIQQLI